MSKKKKILLIVGLLVVCGIVTTVIIINNNWGEYESDITKSDLKDTIEFSNDEEVAPPSLDDLEGNYFVDKANGTAEILFHTKGLKATKGGFKDFTIEFNVPDDFKTSELTVKIKTKSIDTGNEMRDEHLMDIEFFDAANHPEITYMSTSVALGDTSYIAKGELTLNGTTKSLDVPFLHLGAGGEGNNKFEAFEGAFVIDRTAYGQQESSGVGNIVNLNFYCELKSTGR